MIAATAKRTAKAAMALEPAIFFAPEVEDATTAGAEEAGTELTAAELETGAELMTAEAEEEGAAADAEALAAPPGMRKFGL